MEQLVRSPVGVLMARLFVMKARNTLCWMRWRRWSEDRGKVKCWESGVEDGQRWAVSRGTLRAMVCSAVESDVSDVSVHV